MFVAYVVLPTIFRDVRVKGHNEHVLPLGGGFPGIRDDPRSARLQLEITSSPELHAATKIDMHCRVTDMLWLAHDSSHPSSAIRTEIARGALWHWFCGFIVRFEFVEFGQRDDFQAHKHHIALYDRFPRAGLLPVDIEAVQCHWSDLRSECQALEQPDPDVTDRGSDESSRTGDIGNNDQAH